VWENVKSNIKCSFIWILYVWWLLEINCSIIIETKVKTKPSNTGPIYLEIEREDAKL